MAPTRGACDDRHVSAPAPRALPPRPTRRLVRPARGRVLAGVCRGLADHLGVDVLVVRAVFLALALTGGAGLVMYAAFWVFAPPAGDDPAAEGEASRGRDLGYLVAVGTLTLVGVVAANVVGQLGAPVVWPLVVAGAGVVLLWGQADDLQRARWRAATGADRALGVLRILAGVVLVVVGVAVLLTHGSGVGAAGRLGLASLVVVAGLALVSGPWWVRMARDLADERAARIREQERAEIAAHVHDSVLHTLALIQRNVEDPREVTRLARAQERELRAWLYRPAEQADEADRTLRHGLERAAAEVEDAHGTTVQVVVVGDAPLDERARALLLAAREALVNAAKYARGAPVDLYAEVEAERITVYVRDRGPGFDPEAVPPDRLGVRQSILGRMERNGGRARVRSAPGGGTEVELEMPREAPS